MSILFLIANNAFLIESQHLDGINRTGKTEQARADLARLAIIKQHRAEAAARREAEKKGNSHFEVENEEQFQLSIYLKVLIRFFFFDLFVISRAGNEERRKSLVQAYLVNIFFKLQIFYLNLSNPTRNEMKKNVPSSRKLFLLILFE